MVIPCLNEAENIEECVTIARTVMERAALAGEVVVADNGSEDGSAQLAERAGARVVHEPVRGYGSAYLAGLAAARGRYMRDGRRRSGRTDFDEIAAHSWRAPPEAGGDMVIGSRFMDNDPSRRDALAPPLHRQPAASRFAQPAVPHRGSDAHCGMRAFRARTPASV